MSTSTVDIRMAHLIDLGFTPTQSAEFASRYRTVEAAIEAILRETPTQQQQQITSPSARTTRDERYEEHKEMVPNELAPTEWIPLRRVTFTTKAIDTLEDEECDQDKYSSFSSDDVDYFEHAVDGLFLSDSSTGGCEFEVLHSSIGLPSDTPLREWNRKKIIDAFEASTNKWMSKARQEGIATDESATSLALTSNLQDELTFLSVASITDDGETTTSINPLSVNTSGITSACSSTCTTPRIHEEENTEEGFEKEESALATCCFCMDEIPDTLLLPCCHLPLCSSCTLDYFSRLRSHNHSVHQLQQEEVDLIRNHSAVTRRKTQMRTFACPTCATEIHFAVKRRTNESKVEV